jgi:hypothetical protein
MFIPKNGSTLLNSPIYLTPSEPFTALGDDFPYSLFSVFLDNPSLSSGCYHPHLQLIRKSK